MLQPPRDTFTLNDLPNDGQRQLLARWLEIAGAWPQAPSSAMDMAWVADLLSERHVLVDLSAGHLRHARIKAAGTAVRHELGFDPVGFTADRTVPGPYLADMLPAYAICAGTFRPTAALDDLILVDGSRMLTRRLILPFDRQQAGSPHIAGTLLMSYIHEAGDDQLAFVGRLDQIVAVVSRGLWLFEGGN